MRIMRGILLLTGFVALALELPLVSAAGIGVGNVLAYDREAKMVMLTDRSLWSLADAVDRVPAELSAGDRVQFSYETADGKIGKIIEINVTRQNRHDGARRAVNGTVLAFDRKAQTLILEDKSVWPFDQVNEILLGDIVAGNRVRIEYETSEQGDVVIRDFRIIAY